MHIQTKLLNIAEVSKTAGATATALFDTLGANHLSISVRLGTADVVSNKPTVLKLQEADTTDASNLVNIVDFVGGTAVSTSVGFVIPNANTVVTAVLQNDYQFEVDCRARKRYIGVSVSPATTQLVRISGVLSQLEDAPSTAAKANALLLVGA